MKKYSDGVETLSVIRCPAGYYIIKNLGILQNAIAVKEVAQSFLNSWAGKRKLHIVDDLDVDMYYDENGDGSACKSCIAYKNGHCGRM